MPSIAERSPQVDAAPQAVAPSRIWLDGLARVLLVAAWMMCVLPWRPHLSAAAVAGSSATSTAGAAARQALSETGTAVLYRVALIGLIGLAAWRGLPGDRRRWLIAPARVLLLIVAAGAAVGVRYPALAGPVLFAPTALIALWSFTLGRSLERGWLSVFRWLVLSCLALVAAGAGALLTLTDAGAVVVEMPVATAADRNRWQEMLKCAHDGESTLAELRLTTNDLNLMAASWLAAHSSPAVVDIDVGEEDVRSRLTLPLRVSGLGDRFLNLAIRFRPSIINGEAEPRLTALQIGNWSAPSPLVQRASAVVQDVLAADADIQRSLPSIQSLRVAGHELLVRCEPERAAQAATDSLDVAPEASDELRASVRAAMRQLVAAASNLPPGDERFLGLLRAAFVVAQERSTPETAVLENRAVLIALGIQLGDRRVRRLAGFNSDEKLPRFPPRYDRDVTLRGRNDLARHFFVSAALRSLSGKEWSFAIGLIKEQLDAAEGGSGFSFVDLAADLAGVQFAQQATDSNDAARRMQLRMAESFTVDDLMPVIDGLPEGLSQAEFKEQYGFLTDPRFQQVTVEIRGRMADCPLLGVEPAAK